VRRIREVDPHDLAAVEAALKEETAAEELSVIVFRAPCALLVREDKTPYAVDEDACTACGICIRLGCPAIVKSENGQAFVDVSVCVGCGQCVQVCRYDAIVSSGPACDLGAGL
jgi:indolepyruvate ferredoxin oxidoreductase alpha subunit